MYLSAGHSITAKSLKERENPSGLSSPAAHFPMPPYSDGAHIKLPSSYSFVYISNLRI